MERQVALEQATVSGLLSTLNEDAHEDILIEEINNARYIELILHLPIPPPLSLPHLFLLSSLNDDAHEDIPIEEIKIAT